MSLIIIIYVHIESMGNSVVPKKKKRDTIPTSR